MKKRLGISGLMVLTLSVGAQTTAPSASHDDDMSSCPMHKQHVAAKSDDSMKDCPLHAQHMAADGSKAHGAEVDGRHDSLGVSHDQTRHSFRLFADGGAIELRVNAGAGADVVEAIRSHLQMVAKQFAANDFTTPMFVHGKTPDGIPEMQRLHDQISFRYEALPAGARVRITTSSPEALAAVHEFLRFQVVEHRTGDSGVVEPDR